MELPLPWERLLWSGRSLRWPRTHYHLTDLRIARMAGRQTDELALYDVGEVRLSQSALQRWLGTWTLTVSPKDRRRQPLTLADIRRGPQLAAALDLLASEPATRFDAGALQAALDWTPPETRVRGRRGLVAAAAVPLVVAGVAIGLHGQTPSPVIHAVDDAIAPSGIKRSPEDIARFMETSVMPWARVALAPIVGGENRVTCRTCHGSTSAAQTFRMPAVAVLPQPLFRDMGWELYGGPMDPQLRNAIYGYTADSDRQSRATYMREVVMPGMARLLHRPAYDFTRTYEYNRTHQAFGCYHCHRVS